MKAAVLYGDEDFRYEDVADPVVGDNDVKIQVKACGVCGSDIPRGLSGGAHYYPIILGHEFSGVVAEVGKNVTHVKVGDHVKTYSGFYGKIVSIRQTTDGKVVLIEMGEGNKKGYIEADINAIMGIDRKEDVVLDADGNVVLPEEQNKAPQPEKEEEQKEEERVSTADKLRAKKEKKEKEENKEETSAE